MSVDIILEADEKLTEEAVAGSALSSGARLLPSLDKGAFAWFPSGMEMRLACESELSEICVDCGLLFTVSKRCHFRIKGPETPGHSGLDELSAFVHALAKNSAANFVVSFQYESLLYWRDSTGIYKAGTAGSR